MSSTPSNSQSSQEPESRNAVPGIPADVTVHRGEVHLYVVTEDQLDNLASGRWQVYVSLACTFFGSFVSLASIFLAGFTSPSPVHTTITAGATMTSGMLFLVFGAMAYFAYRAHARLVDLIKERRYQS